MANKSNKPHSVNQPPVQSTPHLIATRTTQYEGPIPPAEELAQLEQIKPGLVEKVFAMAEKEQAARLENEKLLIETEMFAIRQEVTVKKRGQFIALAAVVVIVALSGYGFYLGFPTAASTIACTVIVGLAGVFVYSKAKEKS